MRTFAQKLKPVSSGIAGSDTVRRVRLDRGLPIGAPGDVSERQADAAARQVMGPSASQPQAALPCLTDHSQRLQARRTATNESAGAAPASVHETLASSGRPLDLETRAFFEPRFGHDFSRVRIHAGTDAAHSARDVRAHAYTVCSEIVFGAGRFAPATHAGRTLLAHELAHVVQARGGDAVVRRQEIPEFRQKGETCDPASLLTAILMWDRQRYGTQGGNKGFLVACESALRFLHTRQGRFQKKWGKKTYDANISAIASMKTHAARRAAQVTQDQYQELARILSTFDSSDAEVIDAIGLKTKDEAAESFDEIMGSKTLKELKPGESAQVQWYVRSNDTLASSGKKVTSIGYHAVLVGRLEDGEWFLSDQEQGLVLRADTLVRLRARIEAASASGQSWLVTNPETRRALTTWTGVKKIEMSSIRDAVKWREDEPKRRATERARRNEDAALEHESKKRETEKPPSTDVFVPGLALRQEPSPSPFAAFEGMHKERGSADKVADVFTGQLAHLRKTARWLKATAESGDGRTTKEYAAVHANYLSMRNGWKGQLTESIRLLEAQDSPTNEAAIQRLKKLLAWYDAHAKDALFGILKPVPASE